MGFARQPSSQTIDASKSTTVVSFIGEREIDAVLRTVDPFGVADACALSPTGQHYGVGSCGEVVCAHCARVFWR